MDPDKTSSYDEALSYSKMMEDMFKLTEPSYSDEEQSQELFESTPEIASNLFQDQDFLPVNQTDEVSQELFEATPELFDHGQRMTQDLLDSFSEVIPDPSAPTLSQVGGRRRLPSGDSTDYSTSDDGDREYEWEICSCCEDEEGIKKTETKAVETTLYCDLERHSGDLTVHLKKKIKLSPAEVINSSVNLSVKNDVTMVFDRICKYVLRYGHDDEKELIQKCLEKNANYMKLNM